MKIISLSILLFLLGLIPIQAQEMEEEKEIKHNVAILVGVTHIPKAIQDGETLRSQNLATIGADYYYHFNQKWKLGVVVDIELGKYVVEFQGESLKREAAFVTGLVVGYRILKGWSIFTGPGVEFEKNKNLFILRASTDYEFELGENWGLAPVFSYDFKKEYGTYSFGIGVTKGF
ncbi:MAG: hypothetical protein WBM85_15320 [Eudoraea sp.]